MSYARAPLAGLVESTASAAPVHQRSASRERYRGRVPGHLSTRPRRRGSARLGAALVAAVSLGLAACVAMPPSVPADPDIPQSQGPLPTMTDIAPPPVTNGPTDPPVPTTAPGDFGYGETVTIHSQRGSTWEITPLGSIDPADSIATEGCGGTGPAATPRSGSRFVVLELEIANVGVITTHPMHDLTFGYQPDGGPVADQNSASTAASPNDLGCIWEFAPGDRERVQVIVAVRADDPTGTWVITGDDFATTYRFG